MRAGGARPCEELASEVLAGEAPAPATAAATGTAAAASTKSAAASAVAPATAAPDATPAAPDAASPDDAFFSRPFWYACVALALILSSTSLMNIAVFPRFDAVFSYARDISVAVNALFLLGVGAIATFRPGVLHMKPLGITLVAAYCLGAVGLPVSFYLQSAALLVAASCLVALGRAWVTVAVGVAAASLNVKQASACVCIAFVAQCVVAALAWLAPIPADTALFLLFPVFAWLLAWPLARDTVLAVQCVQSPQDLSVTRPTSFLPLASQLFVCLFLFSVAFGCSLRLGEVSGVPLPSFTNIIPVALLAIYVLSEDKRMPGDTVVQLSVLLVVAGFLTLVVDVPNSSNLAVMLLSAGDELFNMVAWLALIVLAGRNRAGAVAAFAWGRGVTGVGTILGAALGVWCNNQMGVNSPLHDTAIALLILVFVAYALLGLRNFSFRETLDGVSPVDIAHAVQPQIAVQTFDERCAAIAQEHGLTPRELEVFKMLARGRDRTYIQEQLVVSRNTVKAHVKHIYAKLDIHSHQDLLDMVEDGEGAGTGAGL